jgi:hypothetical protein
MTGSGSTSKAEEDARGRSVPERKAGDESSRVEDGGHPEALAAVSGNGSPQVVQRRVAPTMIPLPRFLHWQIVSAMLAPG